MAAEFAEGAEAAPIVPSKPIALAAWAALAILGLCGLAFVRGGHVQSDEGWYLTAAREVFEGRLPYRDFMYTQGPLHPYVYGLAQRLSGSGLLAARATSWAFFLAAVALAALVARRFGGHLAALLALALIGSAPMTFWVWMLPLTHASAGFFLVLGIYLLTHPSNDVRREAGGLLALALGSAIRVSLVGALACAVVWIGWRRRSRAALAVAASFALALLVLLVGPFAFASPENFRFAVWGYHALRTQEFSPSPMPVSAVAWWQGKGRFLLELARNFSVLVLAGLIAILIARRRLAVHGGSDRGAPRGLAFIAAVVIVTASISMIPHPVHVTYAGILVPPASVLCGVALAGALAGPRSRWATRVAWALVGCLAIAAWAYARGLDPSELARVRQAAVAIDRALPPGPILTFHNTITAENGRRLLPGLEMGPFAFWPHMADEDAARRRVVNTAKLCGMLESREAVAVIVTKLESGLSRLPCRGEPFGSVLAREYVEVPSLRVPGYGQYGAPKDGGDVLYVFQRRPAR